MHPRLIKTFLAVAQTRSFTLAAAEVNLAQSSVSDQIQSLETELGSRLFIRSTSGLQITPAGETFMGYAEDILALIDEARAALTEDQTKGLIKIGALETIAALKLPQWLSAFREDHRNLDVQLKIAGSRELIRKVETGEIDIAFCFDPDELDERLIKRVVAVEPMTLVTSGKHKFIKAEPDLAELASSSFLATEPGCAYRNMFDRAFMAAGIAPPKPAVEVGSITAIANLVASGAGLGLVPRLAVAEALTRQAIREIPWPGPQQQVFLVMIWRRRRLQPPALKLLLAATSHGFDPKPDDVRPRHARLSPS